MRKVKQPHGGSITLAEPGDVLNPNGPKRNLVSSVIHELKGEGYEAVTQGQVAEIISILLNLDKARVKLLAFDDKQSIYVQRTARRLYGASDKEVGDFIDKQLDRAHGKSKQAYDLSGSLDLSGANEATDAKMAAILKALGK